MRKTNTILTAISAAILLSHVAFAQNSTGNMLTGESKAEVIARYTGTEPLPKPDRVILEDFSPVGDIVMDNSMAARLGQHSLFHHGGGNDSDPDAVVRQIQDNFAKNLIGELKKQNVEVVRGNGVGNLEGTTLIVDGEFVGINQGDKTKRVMLGFGRGASDVKTHVVITLLRNGTTTVVLDSNLNSQSGKKPGAIVGMGSGSLAVGAATHDVTDSKSSVEGDASRMGKLVAKQVATVMVDQKWIPAPAQK